MSIKERSNQPGWRLYHQYQNTIKLAERLGFRIDRAQFAEYNEDGIGVWYSEDRYPSYNHDMQLVSGDLDQIASFLHGIEWAKDYYEMIHLVSDKKIDRKEQNINNKQLSDRLKND